MMWITRLAPTLELAVWGTVQFRLSNEFQGSRNRQDLTDNIVEQGTGAHLCALRRFKSFETPSVRLAQQIRASTCLKTRVVL